MNYDGEIIIGTKIDTEGLENDLEGLKKEFQGGKVSKRIGENDIGQPLIEGIAFAINKNGYQATEAMKNALSELDLQKKLGILNDEQYYNELEVLRDKYFAKGTLGWWNYTAQIISYETKLYNEQQKKIDEIFNKIDDAGEEFDKSVEKSVSEYERKLENLEKKEEKFSSKLASNDILSTVSIKFDDEVPSKFIDGVWQKQSADIVSTQLKDLKGEIKLLETYAGLLEKFSAKENMPQGMSELLKTYGLQDGIDYMNTVLSLSDNEYNSYVADFNKRNELTDEISKNIYNSEAQSIKEEFLGELTEAFGTVDAEFLKCGINAANSFGESFATKISAILESVKTSIRTELESIECSFSVDVSKGTSDTTIYNLYGSGETTAQKLQAARADAELEKLRGGY